MKQILFNIFLWVWCFPQQLLGFILSRKKGVFLRFYTYDEKIYRVYHTKQKKGSISLGSYILLQEGFSCSKYKYDEPFIMIKEQTIKHEYGHYKQNLIFGWLYLLVIGLPSFIWCRCFDTYRIRNNKHYHSFWTEKWADKLGGVKR